MIRPDMGEGGEFCTRIRTNVTQLISNFHPNTELLLDLIKSQFCLENSQNKNN